MRMLSQIYHAMGRTPEALMLGEQCLKAQMQKFGICNADTLLTPKVIPFYYNALGQGDKAASVWKRYAEGVERWNAVNASAERVG